MLSDVNPETILLAPSQHLGICIQNLNRPPYSQIRTLRVPEPVSGTLTWLLTDKDFLHWRDSRESSVYRIVGSPGQGKSVLSKFVLGHLDEFRLLQPPASRPKVIYFFCYNQDKDADYHSAHALLRALILQLVCSQASFDKVPAAYQDSQKGHADFLAAGFFDLWQIFKSLLELPENSNLFCVIDGLDECSSGRQDLLPSLNSLFSPSNLPPKAIVKFFLTSRLGENDIERALQRFPFNILQAAEADIRLYIDACLDGLGPEQGFTDPLKQFTTNLLVENSAGPLFGLEL
jgi:hypothetical protein